MIFCVTNIPLTSSGVNLNYNTKPQKKSHPNVEFSISDTISERCKVKENIKEIIKLQCVTKITHDPTASLLKVNCFSSLCFQERWEPHNSRQVTFPSVFLNTWIGFSRLEEKRFIFFHRIPWKLSRHLLLLHTLLCLKSYNRLA